MVLHKQLRVLDSKSLIKVNDGASCILTGTKNDILCKIQSDLCVKNAFVKGVEVLKGDTETPFVEITIKKRVISDFN